MKKRLAGLWAVAFLCGTAVRAEELQILDHRIGVSEDGMGGDALIVDGTVMHEDEIILLDPVPQVVDGLTVLTGVAGAGGNTCNAAPFVLALPNGAAPEFWGPVDSCVSFSPALDGDRLLFTSEAVPGATGESWLWTRADGFAPGPAISSLRPRTGTPSTSCPAPTPRKPWPSPRCWRPCRRGSAPITRPSPSASRTLARAT